MAKLVVCGAKLKCDQGQSPSALIVAGSRPTDEDEGVATVNDHVPWVNIVGFGLCRSMGNPQVVTATAAALGVVTPQPCDPIVNAVWSPGATVVTIDDTPALSSDSTCDCMWFGRIEITDPASDVDVE